MLTAEDEAEILKLAEAQIAALRKSREADAAFAAREAASIGRDPFARSLAEFRINMAPFHAACRAANATLAAADEAMRAFLWSLAEPAPVSVKEAA